MLRRSICSLGLLAAASLLPPAGAQVTGTAPRVTVAERLGLRQVDVQSLAITEMDRGVEVELALAGTPLTIEAVRVSLRTSDFEVLVEDATGLRRVAAPPPTTIRGAIREIPGSYVSGSLFEGSLRVRIMLSRDEVFFVQPVPNAAADAHAVYGYWDVLPVDNGCALPDEVPTAGFEAADPPAAGSGDPAPSGEDETPTYLRAFYPRHTEISWDTDTQFVNGEGGAEAALNYIETVMVGVDDIYRTNAQIAYVLNRIIIRTAEPDPYTSSDSSTLLGQVRSEWNGNLSALERDVVHLFSGRDFEQNVIGRAYFAGICNTDGYGVNQRITNFANQVGEVAHELGHNWNAAHCAEIVGGNCPTNAPADCGIMCACIAGCNGSTTVFGAASLNSIITHRNGRTCLNGEELVVYVDAAATGTESGTSGAPYDTLREGLWASPPTGGTLEIAGSALYFEDGVLDRLNRPVILRGQPGTGAALIQR